MWHSTCLDDLCPPLLRPPHVPPCCCFQVPRVLDPPYTYSPTLNITLPAGVSSAFLRDHLVPGHARSGLSHDDLRLLDPPCANSPTLNITLPARASAAFLRDHPDPAMPTLGRPMMCCLPCAHNLDDCGSGVTVGRSPRRSDNPLCSPSPHLCLAVLSMSRRCRG